MKVIISYPPLDSDKGTPLLGQNRQFQWFSDPTYIYPIVPAAAATLLHRHNYQVIWNDAIALGWKYNKFLEFISLERPDIIVMETKTPVVSEHWRITKELKALGDDNWQPKIVLMGDHVTALPKETMANSEVDYLITGGNYDTSLLSLCEHLKKDTPLAPGIWYREDGKVKNSGQFRLTGDLDKLPFIDRELTNWRLYSEKNGNFRRLPGTYIMAARDCWWGRCSFCSWTTLYPGEEWQVRSPKNVLDEIGELINKYGVKEIMDDSGTFPVGKWLREFCQGMIERGYNKQVQLDCNMRLGVLKQDDWNLMAKAGFRFILLGLESANQSTLDRLNKNLKVEQITDGVRMAKKAGLSPHITVMVGYPWENMADTQNTIELAKKLFKKGWVDTLQATIVIPYPGTPLYQQCEENGWLKTKKWEEFDMRAPVMSTKTTDEEIRQLTQELYRSFVTPSFFLRKVLSIRGLDDIKFFWRAGRAVVGHLTDFKA